MSFTHKILQEVTGGKIIAKTLSFTGDGQDSRDPIIADAAVDQLVVITIDLSQLKSIFIVSDQDVTLETNDAATPTDTINLKADKPLIWNEDSYFANPFSADVTAMYFTNASGSAAQINIEQVFDATP